MTNAILVNGLHFRYPEAAEWVLHNINLTVCPGETLLILGPSGSGKSTLALCLNGLIPHLIEGEMQGEVCIWGQSTTSQPVSHLCQQVGLVFQDPETQMVMPRVHEEVAFGLENLAVPPSEMAPRIEAALAQVDLLAQREAWVETLSGGQKQRLALAAILALQPSILVLDEPTANLDPLATVTFFQTLRRLRADLGITIVLIEHHLDAALPLVDRLVALNSQGQVIAAGPPQELFDSQAEMLEKEGIWLPATCQLALALRATGWPVTGCPISSDEMEAQLRRLDEARFILAIAPIAKDIGVEALAGPSSQKSAEASTPPQFMENMKCPHLDEPFVSAEKDEPSQMAGPMSPNTAPAILMTNVHFAYPEGPPVLQDIYLRIERGKFFALVGGNGSGKSTLAQHLVGLLRPAQGTIHILGRNTQRQSKYQLAQQVGYVFQNPEHQFVTERVADELAYSLRGRWGEQETDRRVRELLQTFGLAGYAEANPFALSQGQKRRLSVATMVALDQPILVLDEPTFGQDRHSAAALMDTLKALHAAGTTIFFITHDMQLVTEYAEEVAVLHEGRLLFQGPIRALFCQPELLRQAGLTLPPLAELGQRLGQPDLLTVADWMTWIGVN